MKKFLIPFAIGAAVALAVEYFKKDSNPAPVETAKPVATQSGN